ncbi:hypothetical protein B7P43_G00919 [Cryptotermes secundus]|uniref:Uncharacterized protein n=1 Tax=Cryptotermes secundus TaxID=105785 RepID=A0A2J7RT03_9NEOP|nr:hypothetical protein B7P43_G00919 [Cryptotermes secundus]
MKMYTDIASITLSLDLAMTHRLTASLLPSHKFFAILRDIYVQLDQGYSFITALKPENLHVFYASAQVAVLATEEAIRLIIQLPLRHEKRTYLVYDPVALPTFEPNLGKFIRIHTGTEKLAVSSDRRSYMLLPTDYLKNCQEGVMTICQGVVPTIERAEETCLSSLYFGTAQGYSLCTREIVPNNFRPIFRKLPVKDAWLYAVNGLTRIECKCLNTHNCPLNKTSIQGTGVLEQPQGCDILAGTLTLPSSRQFQSRAEWKDQEIIVPPVPALLRPDEGEYLRRNRRVLDEVWTAWEESDGNQAAIPAPMTMDSLQKQVEARLYAWRWTYGGVVAGFTAAATVIGLCLWRHRRKLPVFRRRDARRTRGDDAERDNATPPKDASEKGPHDQQNRDASQRPGNPETSAQLTVYK